jgi:flagellar hook-basal body complex protein FliE
MNLSIEQLSAVNRERIARAYYMKCEQDDTYISQFRKNTENFRNVIKDAMQKLATEQSNRKPNTIVLLQNPEDVVHDIAGRIELLLEHLNW